MQRSFTVLLSILFGSVAASVIASDLVLYQDTFTTGAPGSPLSGHAPDVAVNSNGASGAAVWSTDSGVWTLNGTQAAVSGPFSAWLPLSPQSGFVYTLSADLNPVSGGSLAQWIGLGYSDLGSDLAGFGGVGWANLTIGGTPATFLGTNQRGTEVESDITNPSRISLVLDTSNPTNWSFTWLSSNTDGSNSQVLRSTESFGGVPTIGAIGMTASSVTGTVDNFQLTVTAAVPEPAAIVLALVGTIGLAICARGSRRVKGLVARHSGNR